MIRSHRSNVAFSLGTAVLLAALTYNTYAQISSDSLLKQIPYRELGPYRTGAWTVGVAVPATPVHAHRSTSTQRFAAETPELYTRLRSDLAVDNDPCKIAFGEHFTRWM